MSGRFFLAYVARRCLQAIPLLLGVIVANFLIVQLAPGDPIQVLVGDYPAPPEYVAQMAEALGLDKPVTTQLWRYLGRVVRGDLGFSFVFQRPVAALLLDRLAATLLLMLAAIAAAAVVGTGLGILAARRPYSAVDALTTAGSLCGYSIPVFWLGQMLIVVLAIRLDWFPAQGMQSLREVRTGLGAWADVAHHLALPALALMTRYVALYARLTRSSLIEVLDEDYVRTARAKGQGETWVLFRHALRNALLPVVTIFGLNFGQVMAGSVLTETVFAWPGIGRLMFDSILARDYPVLLGGFIVVSAVILLANLLTDLAYGLLDPRVVVGAGRARART